jgi:hypothetical protein
MRLSSEERVRWEKPLMQNIAWREPLPERCPPNEAHHPEKRQLVLRFVDSQTPQDVDFHSHAHLGKKCPPYVDPCCWASCSVTPCTEDELPQIAFSKLPRVRAKKKYVAAFWIETSAGLILQDHPNHIHLWLYQSFDPLAAVHSTYAVLK